MHCFTHGVIYNVLCSNPVCLRLTLAAAGINVPSYARFANMSVSYSCRSPIISSACCMRRSRGTVFCDGHSQIHAVLYTHMSCSCPVPRSPHLMYRHGSIVHIALSPRSSATVLEPAVQGVADDVGASCKGDWGVGSAKRTVSFQFGSFAGFSMSCATVVPRGTRFCTRPYPSPAMSCGP